jgi:hypothetical protein
VILVFVVIGLYHGVVDELRLCLTAENADAEARLIAQEYGLVWDGKSASSDEADVLVQEVPLPVGLEELPALVLAMLRAYERLKVDTDGQPAILNSKAPTGAPSFGVEGA